MVNVVKNPLEDVSGLLKQAVAPEHIKEENFYVDENDIIAGFPAVRLLYLGGPLYDGDIEGDECATTISFQVESYATGPNKLVAQKSAWDLDAVCHGLMTDLGFRRSYQNLVSTNDSNVKRVVSRYSRIYTGEL